jgi:hypothetical protein
MAIPEFAANAPNPPTFRRFALSEAEAGPVSRIKRVSNLAPELLIKYRRPVSARQGVAIQSIFHSSGESDAWSGSTRYSALKNVLASHSSVRTNFPATAGQPAVRNRR